MSHFKFNVKKACAVALSALISGFAFTNCTDDIPEENRFTFKGELIATHLEKNPEKFSKFTEILKRAKLGNKSAGSILKTLSTYGSYTCFAPTNEAVDSFLTQQYNLYMESVEAHKEDPSNPIIDKGITSPYLEDLSDSMAIVIAKNHIIEMGYKTIDISEGSFPMATMNNRTTTVEWITDDAGRVFTLLNNSARIIDQDLEMENGYIQVVDAVLNPSSDLAFDHLEKYSEFSLFAELIKKTGMDELLSIYHIDPSYDPLAEGTLLNTENVVAPLPKDKKQRYTLLVEPDALFNKLGYFTVDDIFELAKKFYKCNDEAILKDFHNQENPLWKFVAYHVIDRQLSYNSGTGPGGFIMQDYDHNNFKSKVNLDQNFDSYDYFETLLPYSMIKVTKPYTNEELKQELIVNYAQEKGTALVNPDMKDHINVVIERASTTKEKYPELKDFEQTALNAIIHTIDRILIYDETEMAGNILKERIRVDLGSLFPEFTNNFVRWDLSLTGETATFIPGDYSVRLKVNNENCEIFYLRPHQTWLGSFALIQGDELLVEGKYDFEYRIPHVPTGNYELRFGYGKGYYRGVCQFYFDGKIAGIPVDLRWNDHTSNLIGWEQVSGMSEEEARASDKAMRNRGYMRGPASIVVEPENSNGTTLRHSEQALRKIVGTFHIDGKRDYWLRFKDVSDDTPGATTQFEQDYLELVPVEVLNDPKKPEDIY